MSHFPGPFYFVMAQTETSFSEKALRGHDIIVVGASAGGVEALAELVSRLPADLPAAVFVVLHVPAYGVSVLPGILSRRGRLPAVHPADGEPVQGGRIYVAPPDHHLILKDGYVRLTRGPHENGHRPAVDTLFRSAARTYGPRVIGVVLTGTLDDGTAGLQAIKIRGGLAVVQDPEDALFASMPRSAIENVPVDHIAPLAEIAPTLVRLARQPAPGESNAPMPPDLEEATKAAEFDMSALETRREGKPSSYACPDCHGVLWEVQEDDLLRFRCRVGHAFSPESLLAAQSDALEDALWTALRALEESAALTDRLGGRAGERGHDLAAGRFEQQATDARGRAGIIRQALLGGQIIAQSGPPGMEENARSVSPPNALGSPKALGSEMP